MSNHDGSFGETVPTAVLLEINRLCVEFEHAWRDGQSPRVEDFATRMSGEAQLAAIRELIAQEVDLRWAAGQPAEAEEYHQRFPKYVLAVNEVFSFAHQKGFVHRDLKPANILLDAQLRPRVADFGLAVHETIQRRRRGDRSGTPAYMSPEQVRGETHRLDGRSDIWSLGVILYELLTRHRPFHGDNRDELFDEIKHRDPTPPRQRQTQVPAELDRICLKCLNKQVTDRYSSAVDLIDDLRHWLEPRVPAAAFGLRENCAQGAAIVRCG